MATAILGVAVCAMYASGALVLLEGLQAGSATVIPRLEVGPFLAYQGAFPDVRPAPLPEAPFLGAVGAGWLRDGTLTAGNDTASVRLLSFPVTRNLPEPAAYPLARSPEAKASALLLEELALPVGASVRVEAGAGSRDLPLGRAPAGPLVLPERWVLVPPDAMASVAPVEDDRFDLLLVAEAEDAQRLAEGGYTVLSLTSAVGFFQEALEDARDLVFTVVVASAVAVGALTFSLLSLEIRYRRREMATLRAVGMDRGGFLRLYGLQLAYLVGAGTALGLALGIVVANGLVSFAPFVGLPTIIRPQVTALGLAVPLLSTLAAGAAGGVASLVLSLRRRYRAA